jgi:pimeloyl-ACP methyl ester carboxylesterase
MVATLRFLRRYLRPDAAATTAEEVVYARGSDLLPGTVYRPAGTRRSLPAWTVLHGLTRTGREHPSLVRFARAVASAGNVVFVPEIPEWRALRVNAGVTVPTIAAAVQALQARDDVRHEHVGLFGFSFGATQGLVAAAQPGTARLLSGMAAWGGYCDLHRLFRFGLTGLHEIDGVTYRTRPDPYGAWIIAGNYLARVPGFEGAGGVADAVMTLAMEAGDRGLYAWDPAFDESKRRLRAALPQDRREIFDLLAPPTTAPRRDDARLLELSDALAATVLRLDPLMQARDHLPAVGVPVVFAHGRDDRLIPFSETMRLARATPPERVRSVTITSLFQHSGGTSSRLGAVGMVREGARFLLLLRRVLRLV